VVAWGHTASHPSGLSGVWGPGLGPALGWRPGLCTLTAGLCGLRNNRLELLGAGLGPPLVVTLAPTGLPLGPYLSILSFPTKLISPSFQEFLFPPRRLLVSPQARFLL
jgi:hypothetical protein